MPLSQAGLVRRPDRLTLRRFRFPGDVGHDAIKAAYKDGVLEITIAKRPEAKAVKIEVAYSN
jgi:HSP20 family molecular chaperone IbpA